MSKQPATSRLGRIIDSLKSSNDQTGALELSITGLFRCMFCTQAQSNTEQMQLLQISDQLNELDNKFKILEMYEVVYEWLYVIVLCCLLILGNLRVKLLMQIFGTMRRIRLMRYILPMRSKKKWK